MTPRPSGAPSRLGPRPLPLHLMTATSAWLSSRAASPFLKTGLLPWKPALAEAGRDLQEQLAGVGNEAFAEALDRELRTQADAFLTGLERYRAHPYRRSLPEAPVVWQEGSTRLLDYAPGGGIPILVVPSLINRAYVLDLAEDQSLLRFLAAAGFRPLLIDWGQPQDLERGFGLTDYVAGRLDTAAEAAVALTGAPLILLGYCMGGLLGLALAQRRRRSIRALVLLATPWDFHAERPEQARLLGAASPAICSACGPLGEIPTDLLQSFFTGLDPYLAVRKFTRFANLDQESEAARRFVALEDWLNDGVPLALPAARECLEGWYGANEPVQGKWRIAGSAVDPSRYDGPALVVTSQQDRIVPLASAEVLGRLLPAGNHFPLRLGHIGMVASAQAQKLLWEPLVDWLRAQGPVS